jgi:hypothetical protein
MRTATIPLLALSAVLAGCQSPDVGQACELQTGAGGVNLNVVGVPADFFESGNLGCDNLVCIKSPDQPAGSRVSNNPYCSKACVSNSDCFESETGLVCRPVTVDLNFVKTLPPAQQAEYFRILGCQVAEDGTATDCPLPFERYCAAPLQ